MPGLGVAQGKIVIDTSDVKAAEGRVKQSSQQMNKALSAIGVTFGLEAVRRLGDMAFQLAETAAKAEATRGSFEDLAATVGSSASAMLESMGRASRGTISDTQLMLGANRALISGVADSNEDLTQLLEISRATAKNFGIDTAEAFSRIVQSLAKLEPELIDEIGITVRLDKVFRDYAESVGTTADNLTDAQRKAAFFNQVVKQTQKIVDANAGSAESAADKFAQFNAELENTKTQLGEFLLAAGATDGLDTLNEAFTNSIKQLELVDKFFKDLKQDWDSLAGAMSQNAFIGYVTDRFKELAGALAEVQAFMAWIGGELGTRQTNFGSSARSGKVMGSDRAAARGGGSGSSLGDTPAAVNTKLLDAQRDYAKELAEINRSSAQEIAEVTRDGARQRADIINDYNLSVLREEQDFNRQRARSQRDYEQSIERLQRDAAEREAEMVEDLNRTITRAREDSNERIAEIEEEYARSRENALADHRDRLLSAAGRLDAIAILEERKRFARESKEAEDAHDEQIDEERESLQESIDQANEAHREQLEDARQADRQRLQDMRDAREQQLTDEDEDRRIRRERDAEDHRLQLEAFDIAQAERIRQIGEQAEEQRRALADAHAEELYDLGEHTFAMGEKRRAEYKEALELHDEYMKELRRQSMDLIRQLPTSHPSTADPYLDRTTPTSARNSRSVSATINIYGDGLNEREVASLVADYIEAL